MNRHDRLAALLEMVVAREHVQVEDVVTALSVSPATVRRDLDSLAAQQLVVRTRGGASVPPSSGDLPLRYKTARQSAEKARIARAAANMVQPGEVVGMNGGTTTTEVARELAVHPVLRENGQTSVTVVTNAVNIAAELAVRTHLRVVMTGGVVRAMSYELTGPLADLLLGQVTVDTLFLGINGLTVAEGACAHDEGEASIAAALAGRAGRVVVVADSTKLGRRAFARIVTADRIDEVVTDDGADPGVVSDLEAAGLTVTCV
ncbi:DeoR/GlpR family DNA-binding transcription regulator [Ruania halotolerans]|uniref:DeoR/GlpR family DNA-binding transcription regulator n=1 Tax=Ruania halotolerans TaxID=2897773 RepID=UPI001E586519|nr:DeoR/GlpR family DNA-binding transcription regulator [Ruania halotolerans]UFU05016.1 DeoR/GlpR family DNA-binding transcription regulator [Ruania halotolerans]